LHHTFGFECGVSETLAIHHCGDLFYVAADVIVPGDDNPKVRACRVKEVKDSRSFRETAHCWVLKKKQLLQGGHEVK
jgi:hypothetical protein